MPPENTVIFLHLSGPRPRYWIPFQRNKFNRLMETDLSIAARGHLANGFTRLHLGRLRR
jgi:hypothetical protein